MENLEKIVTEVSSAVMDAENHGITALTIAQFTVSVAIFKALVLIHKDQATWKNQ